MLQSLDLGDYYQDASIRNHRISIYEKLKSFKERAHVARIIARAVNDVNLYGDIHYIISKWKFVIERAIDELEERQHTVFFLISDWEWFGGVVVRSWWLGVMFDESGLLVDMERSYWLWELEEGYSEEIIEELDVIRCMRVALAETGDENFSLMKNQEQRRMSPRRLLGPTDFSSEVRRFF